MKPGIDFIGVSAGAMIPNNIGELFSKDGLTNPKL